MVLELLMKVIFDIDGTLTDYNLYIQKNAITYFQKKYKMYIKYPNALEVEDIFDMDAFFMEKYKCDKQIAKSYTKQAIEKYWISIRFFKFAFMPFRKNAASFVKSLRHRGYIVEIHSSRAKTSEYSFVGFVARTFTYLQFIKNGIFPLPKFFFYKDDDSKLRGIINSNPDIVFDDKSDILKTLSSNSIKTFCLNGQHNTDLTENTYLKKIVNFTGMEHYIT